MYTTGGRARISWLVLEIGILFQALSGLKSGKVWDGLMYLLPEAKIPYHSLIKPPYHVSNSTVSTTCRDHSSSSKLGLSIDPEPTNPATRYLMTELYNGTKCAGLSSAASNSAQKLYDYQTRPLRFLMQELYGTNVDRSRAPSFTQETRLDTDGSGIVVLLRVVLLVLMILGWFAQR